MIFCYVTVFFRAFERLEPDEVKVSSPVLRGGGGSNAASLPGDPSTGSGGRIAQYRGDDAEYFLGDALLDSVPLSTAVRQLTDAQGKVILGKSYQPFGEELPSPGTGKTNYGFTGEWSEAGLVYLRARFYAPQQGRFISRDTWEGNYYQPASYNRWLYANANPLRYIDPSGRYNRLAAVQFARTHDLSDKFPDDGYVDFTLIKWKDGTKATDCTAFVSTALSVGGVRDNRPDPREKKLTADYTPGYWPGYEATRLSEWNGFEKETHKNFMFYRRPLKFDSWMRTPELHDFLTETLNYKEVTYDEIPQFYGVTPLPNSEVNKKWIAWLEDGKKKGNIDYGDVVFYKSGDDQDWGHAAMIVGWGVQTYYDAPWSAWPPEIYTGWYGPCSPAPKPGSYKL